VIPDGIAHKIGNSAGALAAVIWLPPSLRRWPAGSGGTTQGAQRWCKSRLAVIRGTLIMTSRGLYVGSYWSELLNWESYFFERKE